MIEHRITIDHITSNKNPVRLALSQVQDEDWKGMRSWWCIWIKYFVTSSSFYLHITSFSPTHSHISSNTFSLSLWAMALNTVSSVSLSQVLRLSDTIGNRHLFVDFAPFRRNTKRCNRRLTPAILRRSSVKAVLQLDNNHLNPAPPPSSPSTSDSKPKVRFLHPLLFLHNHFVIDDDDTA